MRAMVIISLVLCLACAGSASLPDGAVPISGQVRDCWKGVPRPIRKLDIFIASKKDNVELLKLLEEFDKSKNPQTDQETNHLIDVANKLNDLVGHKKSWLTHVKTDQTGRFKTAVNRKVGEVIVLAIALDVEDEISYHSYALVNPTARTNAVDMWMSQDGCSSTK
jgi:hypothetical protein